MAVAATYRLALLLTRSAPNREWQGLQASRRYLRSALRAQTELPGVESVQGLFNTRKGLALHLQEREFKFTLNVRLRPLSLVLHFAVVHSPRRTCFANCDAKGIEDSMALAVEDPSQLPVTAQVRGGGVRALANDLEVLPHHAAQRTDSAIAEAAANALTWDSAIPAKAVHVTLNQGWVTLTGEVAWRYQRDAAEQAVRPLYGVKGITNAVTVKPKVRVADVTAGIEGAFKRSAEIDAKRVHVEARDGTVILTGTVRSFGERREAERAA